MNYLSNKRKICISVTIPYMQTKLLGYIIMYLRVNYIFHHVQETHGL